MTAEYIWKLWHVISVGLFSGALLAMLALQGLVSKAAAGEGRTALATTAATLARTVVMPVMYLAFFSGLAYWFSKASQNPIYWKAPYIHVMATCGFLSVGLAQAWKANARKYAEALSAGRADAGVFLKKGTTFVAIAFLLNVAAFIVAVFRVPAPRL